MTISSSGGGFGKVAASKYYLYKMLVGSIFLGIVVTAKKAFQKIKKAPSLFRSYFRKKPPYFVLKEDDESKGSNTDYSVEDSSQEFHFKNIRYQKPANKKGHDTQKDIECAGSF